MQFKKAKSFLLLSFTIFFCGHAFCGQTPVQFTTKHNLLFTALPPDNGEAVYKFDGTFYADRIAQLEYIAEEGGSTQSNDCLEYGEYLKLREGGNFSKETIEKFEKAVKQMDEKIEQIRGENPILGTKRIEMNEFRAKLDNEIGPAADDESSLLHHQLVIKCKQFMRKLMSEEGEGSWVDIYSFMGAEGTEERHGTTLWNIYELAKIQSAKLDEMINEAMWAEHEENWAKKTAKNGQKKKGNERVLIEGAGPIGLFCAVHLFLAGANVTLVNDRPELYSRNHMTFLDAKFLAQFRFFLGTKFDEIYNKERSFGRINTLDGEVGQQNVKDIEQILKMRLVELASFVESKIGPEQPSRLKLLYQTEITGIKSDGQIGIEAIVKVSPKFNAKEQKHFNKRKVEIRAKNRGIDLESAKKQIFDEKVENAKEIYAARRAAALHQQKQTDQSDLSSQKQADQEDHNAAVEQVRLEMEGKVPELRHLAPIPFDILFCAGGANDRIRNKLLGNPIRRSISKNYGLVVFHKGNPNEKDGIMEQRVFDHLTGFFKVKMSDFEPILQKQNFDKFVTNHGDILPKEFIKKYENLTQLIVRGLVKENEGKYEEDEIHKPHTKHIYKQQNGSFMLADPKEEPSQIVRLVENRPTLHIASITPPAVEEFVRDIKREWQRSENDQAKQQLINEMRVRFERKWSAAIFDMCLGNAHPEKVGEILLNMDTEGVPGKEMRKDQLNFDPSPYNASVFPLTIFAVEKAVKVKEGTNGQTAIIAAIGDANTSPHFMTTSGLSTGRLGVEWSAYALRDYHQGKITEKELIERMSKKLNSIEQRVVKKVREYVTIEDKEGEKTDKASTILDKDEDKVYKAIYHAKRTQ
ncbi:hypothetical protein niasHS_011217 [Heterodera schachtii]|uniref:Uncharacterized protein n=1 Tax=Heterodera schachtii TaxID=97005 RepID=A0ABD2J1C6_HETSC